MAEEDRTTAAGIGAAVARGMVLKLSASSGRNAAVQAARGAIVELAQAVEARAGLSAARVLVEVSADVEDMLIGAGFLGWDDDRRAVGRAIERLLDLLLLDDRHA